MCLLCFKIVKNCTVKNKNIISWIKFINVAKSLFEIIQNLKIFRSIRQYSGIDKPCELPVPPWIVPLWVMYDISFAIVNIHYMYYIIIQYISCLNMQL